MLAPVRSSSAAAVMLPIDPHGVVERRRRRRISYRRGVLLVQRSSRCSWRTTKRAPFSRSLKLPKLARCHGVAVHTDAVQAAGRMPIDFAALGVDTLAISAHKFGGPKGVGALVIRDHLDLVPFVRGGGQERRRRAGTENVAAIAGFGAAAEAALRDLQAMAAIRALRDEFEADVKRISPGAVIIGEGAPRLANTTALALPGKPAETLVIRLDLAGIAVSAGSACSSGKVGASHVLEAMGFGQDIAASTIRISLGPTTTKDDISAFLAAWKTIVGEPALAA